MGFSAAAENAALNGIKAASTTQYISLHSADPGDTGTPGTEITGGSYQRQPVTWPTNATNSSLIATASVTLQVPSETTISHWGLWTAQTGGTFLYGGGLPAPETFGSNGTYSLTPTLSASDT